MVVVAATVGSAVGAVATDWEEADSAVGWEEEAAAGDVAETEAAVEHRSDRCRLLSSRSGRRRTPP